MRNRKLTFNETERLILEGLIDSNYVTKQLTLYDLYKPNNNFGNIYNEWTLSLKGFLSKCKRGPVFEEESDQRYDECDRIRIYYPNREVAEKFITFIRFFLPKFKNIKAKIYTDRQQFKNEVLNYKKNHSSIWDAWIMDTHYIHEDHINTRTDLCIDLWGFKMHENKDFDSINFTKEYGKVLRG